MPTQAQRLIYAVRTGNHERLRKFIRDHNGISIVSAARRTALHAAAEEGDFEAARILIEAGADVNALMQFGNTPLHLAAAYGRYIDLADADPDRRECRNRRRRRCRDPQIAQLLMEIIMDKEPAINSLVELFDPVPGQDLSGSYVQALGFLENPTAVLDEVFARGVDLDKREPLLAEQLRGNPRYLRVAGLLLDHGADIAAVDTTRNPVLRGAVEMGTPGMVELLIKHGANPNQMDSVGLNLIAIALERCRTKIADTLLSCGAQFDPNAGHLLHGAAANARLNVVRWLLDHGADINQRNDNGDSVLHAAAGHTEVFSTLLARRADLRIRNNRGESVLHAAACLSSCLIQVINSGLPIDEQNAKGRTALHTAISAGSLDSVRMLVAAGTSINAQDHAGETPLHVIFDSDEFRPDIEFPTFHALVSLGADRTIKNAENKTPFDLAVQWSYPQEYLDLLDPKANRPAETFIWLGDERYRDFLPQAAVSFEMDGWVWPSSEHYFHAQKTSDPEIREKIRATTGVRVSARKLEELNVKSLRTWPSRCDKIMHSALLSKFRDHHGLRLSLLATGEATLIADSNCTNYWLENPESGFNEIGKMLMDVRSQLHQNPEKSRV